jgi:nucleoid-associated protein EbfC
MTDSFDLNSLLEQAMAMQQQMANAQEQAAAQVVEGHAGGGAVKVTMTGGGELTSIRLAPDVVDPTDIEMLEDLILAAFHDAQIKVTDLQQQAMGPLAGGLGGLLGG